MKVVLLQDVRGMGRRGEVREAKDGYARNFLVPRRLAEPATAEALGRVAALAAKREREREGRAAAVQGELAKLAALPIQFYARAGAQGELYGSVTAEDLATFLQEHGIAHVRGVLTPPLKKVGAHAVVVDFGDEIKKTVTVTITPAPGDD